MKKLMFGGALVVLALASCGKKPAGGVSASQEAELPARELAQATPEVLAPDARLFSLPGTFFLVKKVSVETDSGFFNYQPGTKVSRLGSHYVAGDGRQLKLRADQITNDLSVAQRVAGNDPKLQVVIQAAIQTARTMQATAPKVPASRSGLAAE